MPNINLAPYPYTSEQQAIDRRRQLALALQQQSMQPVEEPSVPGANVSWTQGLAKMVNALMGGRLQNQLDQRQKGLESRMMADRGSRAADFAKVLIGDAPPTAQQVTTPATPAQVPGAQPWQPPTFPMDSSGPLPPTALPGTIPAQPAQTSMVQQPPTAEAQQGVSNAREQLARLLSSPFPDQQKLADVVISKSMSNDEEEKKLANAMLLAQYNQQHRPVAEGAAVPDGKGGYTIPSPKASPVLRPFAPGDYVQDPNAPDGFRQVGTPKPPAVTGSLTPKTVLFQGKPVDVQEDLRDGSPTKGHVFLPTPNGPQDVTGQTQHYERPADTSQAEANRNTRLYEFHMGEINKQGTAIDALATRVSRLNDTLNQPSTVSEALIAPELLSIMSGGQGSGLRMNQAELNQINNARGFWENLKTAVTKFNPNDQKTLILSPEQKTAIRKLSDMVGAKVMAKQQVISDAKQSIAGANSDNEQKQAYVKFGNLLNAIDAGKAPAGQSGNPSLIVPGGALDKLINGH